MLRKSYRYFLTAIILLACVGLAEACPTCKQGLAENDMNMVRGFGWSIIFMMSVPFLTLGGLSGYFYYEVCKARRLGALQSLQLQD